jgi:hypothetical protein
MIHVKIANNAETTLTLTHDDLYIIEFKNDSDHWYMVKGLKAEGTITLPVKKKYDNLIPRGHKKLNTILCENESTVQAMKTLTSYNPRTTPILQLQQALLKFMIMISETMRFKVVEHGVHVSLDKIIWNVLKI